MEYHKILIAIINTCLQIRLTSIMQICFANIDMKFFKSLAKTKLIRNVSTPFSLESFYCFPVQI